MGYPTAYRTGAVAKGYTPGRSNGGSRSTALGFVAPAGGLAALRGSQVAAARMEAIAARAFAGVPSRAVASLFAAGALSPAASAALTAAGLLSVAWLAYEAYELFPWQKEQTAGYDFTGFDVLGTCPTGSFAEWGFHSGISSCGGVIGYYDTEINNWPDSIPNGSLRVHSGQRPLPNYRYTYQKVGLKRQAGTTGVPEWMPARPAVWFPPVRPYVAPALDPFSLPIQVPVGPMVPMPYKVIPHLKPNPFRSPTEQTQRGPRPRTRPDPALRPNGPTVSIDSDGNITRTPNDTHEYANPGPRQKEKKKMALRTGGTAVRLAFDTISEIRDAVEAIWDALPKDKRTKGYKDKKGKGHKPRLPAMLNDLWKNWDHVDWNKAIDGLVENEAKDRFFGRVGRAMGAAAVNTGAPVSAQFGPVL